MEGAFRIDQLAAFIAEELVFLQVPTAGVLGEATMCARREFTHSK